MRDKQLLTIIAVIKKMQLQLKNINTSNIEKDLLKLREEFSKIDIQDNKQDIDKLNEKFLILEYSFKALINQAREELDTTSISYQDKLKELSTSLELSLNGIQDTLKDFIKIDSIEKIEKDIESKLNSIEPQKEIEIGVVKTLDPGMEAKVEVRKTKDTYKLDFYIPRGVSGRGQPGANGVGVPTGGTTNQVLVKNSNSDYDTKWSSAGSTSQIQSDWNQTNNTEVDYIKNKPTIPTKTSDLTNDSNYVVDASYVHTDNNFTDTLETKLNGIEAGAEVNVNADWNSSTGDSQILNKPTITDEKVKYDAGDSTPGYVADKIIAGTGISVAEGTGGNENKLVITNSNPTAYTLPTASTTVKGGVKVDGTTITITDEVISAVTGGSGDVTGPAGATADDIVLFDGATGKLIKDSGKKLSEYEPVLPTTPTSPETKYLNGNRQWTEVITGSYEVTTNKENTTLDTSTTKYPTNRLTKEYADTKLAKATNVTAITDTGIADGEIAVFNLTNKDIRTSDKTITTSLGADDTTVPTSKAVKDVTDGKVTSNVAIVGATKTKISYDTKGLVTSGADATTADIADSTNKRYVTDAQLVVIGNTSNTNTGDQTSIVGISGTKAQFDTACSDGNFLYSGDITQYTDEMAQDAVGTILTDTATIDFTYTDASNKIEAAVKDASITLAKMANLAQNTIIGRVTASTGVPEALTAANVRTIINVADGATANTKCTGAEIDTGTDDVKFATAKAITDSKLIFETDIIDNLTSTSTTDALSANQGKALNDNKANLSGATFTGIVQATTFRTTTGTVSCTTGTATDAVALSAPAFYLVSVWYSANEANNPYMGFAVISTDGTTRSKIHLSNFGTAVTITMNNLNVRITQTSGITLTMSYSVLRLA